MASVNRVTLIGNLGRDPEMRTFPSGDQVANVTIATTDFTGAVELSVDGLPADEEPMRALAAKLRPRGR